MIMITTFINMITNVRVEYLTNKNSLMTNPCITITIIAVMIMIIIITFSNMTTNLMMEYLTDKDSLMTNPCMDNSLLCRHFRFVWKIFLSLLNIVNIVVDIVKLT